MAAAARHDALRTTRAGVESGGSAPAFLSLLPSDLACWPAVRELLQELQERLINEKVSDQETCWYLQVAHNAVQKEKQEPHQGKASSSLSPSQASGRPSASSTARRLRTQVQASARKKPGPGCVWYGMLQYLKEIPREEADSFLFNTLPRIIELALGIEDCTPETRLRQGATTKVSRQFVCAVLACLFLCLFPEQHEDEASPAGTVNFTALFKQLPRPDQVARLQCILCYFERVIKHSMEISGHLVLSKKCMDPAYLMTFEELTECELKLCPVSVQQAGGVPDSEPDALHVDFATRRHPGECTHAIDQEDVMLSLCPEVRLARLFADTLEPSEACIISGFEQFSSCTGSDESLHFSGPYGGCGQPRSLVFVGGEMYRDTSLVGQYQIPSLVRDLQRAVLGFSQTERNSRPAASRQDNKAETRGTEDVAADMVTSVLVEAVSRAVDGDELASSCNNLPQARVLGGSQEPHHTPGAPDQQRLWSQETDRQSSQQLAHTEERSYAVHSSEQSVAPIRVDPEECRQLRLPSLTQHHPSPFSTSGVSPPPPASSSLHPATLGQGSDQSSVGGGEKQSASASSLPLSPSSSSPPSLPPPPLPLPRHEYTRSPVFTAASERIPPTADHSARDAPSQHPPSPQQLPPLLPPTATPSSVASPPSTQTPAADLLPSASAPRQQHRVPPSLVLRTAQGIVSHVFFESDPLGNLSRVRVDRADDSLPGLSHDAQETDDFSREREGNSLSQDQRLKTRNEDESTIGSSSSPLHLQGSGEAVGAFTTSTSSSHHHTGGGHHESNIPSSTAEELDIKVSSGVTPLSTVSPATATTTSTTATSLEEPVDFVLPPPAPFSSSSHDDHSLEVTLPLPTTVSLEDSQTITLPSYHHHPSSSLVDSCEDLHHGNPPRSLDITIPVPVPSLSGQSLERAGSGLSNFSMVVNVDSPTPSCVSVDDDLGRMLYVSVDHEEEREENMASAGGSGAGPRLGSRHSPRQHKRLMSPRGKLIVHQPHQLLSFPLPSPQPGAQAAPLSSSSPYPHSPVSSHNNSSSSSSHDASVDTSSVSASISHPLPEKDAAPTAAATTTTTTTSSGTAAATISTSPSNAADAPQHPPLSRQNSRDLYVELKEFLSSSSSGSRDSTTSWGGIHPALSSSSSFSSRSGSLSSHRGSNGFTAAGSTGDFLEFWNHHRRRSSQLSQMSDCSSSSTSGASRRSSSSHKYNSDFSMDLEDISESLLKYSHGVIEEEGGGGTATLAEFASHFVSAAVRNGVVTAAMKAPASPRSVSPGGLDTAEPVPGHLSVSVGSVSVVRDEKTGDSELKKDPTTAVSQNSSGEKSSAEEKSRRSDAGKQHLSAVAAHENSSSNMSAAEGVSFKSQTRSAIPVLSGASAKPQGASLSSFKAPGKGSGQDTSTGSSLSGVKADRSSAVQAVHTRRGLMGKPFSRTGTLVRQQGVNIHPEDEEGVNEAEDARTVPRAAHAEPTVAGKLPDISGDSQNMEAAADDVKVGPRAEKSDIAWPPLSTSTKGFEPMVERGLGLSQQTSRGDAELRVKAGRQSHPKPTPSESGAPDVSVRLEGEAFPPCPSADSGYLSLVSASSRAGLESAFQCSPSSASLSPQRTESPNCDVKAAPVITNIDREERGPTAKTKDSPMPVQTEKPVHSDPAFIVKTAQHGGQALYATLETKTIYLTPPPPSSLSASAETKAVSEHRLGDRTHTQSEKVESGKKIKKRDCQERQIPSGSHRANPQGSAIPRKRTASEPSSLLPRKSSSRAEGKSVRQESRPKKVNSDVGKGEHKPKRMDRAMSEPSGALLSKHVSGAKSRSTGAENQSKKPESVSTGDQDNARKTELESGKGHRDSKIKSRISKVASGPIRQDQTVKQRRSRRFSNASSQGDGADGSVASSNCPAVSVSPSGGASGPSKSSSIPKYRDPLKKTALPSAVQGKGVSASHAKLLKSEMGPSVKEKTGKERKHHPHSLHHGHDEGGSTSVLPSEKQARREPLFRPHKSRYVFSDVAAPLKDKKIRRPAGQSSSKRNLENQHHHHHHHHQHHHQQRSSDSKRPPQERRKSSKVESRVKEKPALRLTPKVMRFVSSVADSALSEAVLEGADIVSQRSLISSLPGGQVEEISDEVYSWFSNKIINQVFSHIIQGLESRERLYQPPPAGGKRGDNQDALSSMQLREIGASSGSPGEEFPSTGLAPPTDPSATDSVAQPSSSPLSVSCLATTQPTTAASPSSPSLKSAVASGRTVDDRASVDSSSHNHRRQGSLKMVKFQVSSSRRGSDADAAETPEVIPPHNELQPAASSVVSPSLTSPLHIHLSPSSTSSPTLFPAGTSANIGVPVRRRSSFDLASPSPPVLHHHTPPLASSLRALVSSPPLSLAAPLPGMPSSFTPADRTASGSSDVAASAAKMLSAVDLSLDVYQVAANIVDQVFQNISDSVAEAQAGISGHYSSHGHETGGQLYQDRRHNIFSSSSAASPSSSGNTKTTGKGSNHNHHHHHQQTRRSVSPSLGGLFSRQPMSRQVLTSAFLRVEGGGGWGPTLRTYQRRSSEPGQTSVQLSLQALNSIKFSSQAADEQARQRKVSRTDDDIGRHSSGCAWRRGSLDGAFTASSSSSFEGRRRSSCGFKDPMLSRFAEELMKADTSVPELVIVGSHPSSSSTGSRRSSFSGFRGTTLANLESELLNTSFTSVNSLPLSTSNSPRSSQRRHRRRHRRITTTTATSASTCDSYYHYHHPDLDRSHSRESAHSQASGGAGGGASSHQWKSDSSDTEYWFPPPRLVGEEFRVEYERQHSQEELQDYASFFAGQVVQEAVCVLRQDPDFQEFAVKDPHDRDVEIFAENLTDQIMRDVFLTTARLRDTAAGGGGGDGGAFPESDLDSSFEGRCSSRASVERWKRGVEREMFSRYHGEGARPKIRAQAQGDKPSSRTLTPSKALNIPPRKQARDRGVRDAGGPPRRREGLISSAPVGSGGDERREKLPRQHHQLHIPVSTGLRSSSPQSHPLRSPLLCVSPGSRHHASRTAVSSSSSSLPIPIGSSHRSPHPKLMSKAPTTTSLLSPTQSALHSRESSKLLTRHPGSGDYSSCSSSDSSYCSDNTSSSLLSSSSEEDIGPQGLLFPDDEQRLRRLARGRQNMTRNEDAEDDATKLSSKRGTVISVGDLKREKQMSVKEQLDSSSSRQTRSSVKRKTLTRTARPHRKSKSEQESAPTVVRGSDECGEETERGPVLEPAVAEFVSSLSETVLREALVECSTGRWRRFWPDLRPVATGNCGWDRSHHWDSQLSFVVRWLAASVARCPRLIYSMYGDPRLKQAEDVVQLLSGRTVGELAEWLRSYCNLVGLHLSAAAGLSFPPHSSSSSSSAARRLHPASSALLGNLSVASSAPQTSSQLPVSTPPTSSSPLSSITSQAARTVTTSGQQQHQWERPSDDPRVLLREPPPPPVPSPDSVAEREADVIQLPLSLFDFLREKMNARDN